MYNIDRIKELEARLKIEEDKISSNQTFCGLVNSLINDFISYSKIEALLNYHAHSLSGEVYSKIEVSKELMFAIKYHALAHEMYDFSGKWYHMDLIVNDDLRMYNINLLK